MVVDCIGPVYLHGTVNTQFRRTCTYVRGLHFGVDSVYNVRSGPDGAEFRSELVVPMSATYSVHDRHRQPKVTTAIHVMHSV
jgi:hypothetical protein